jgi:DNA-binding NtrC family response regulator
VPITTGYSREDRQPTEPDSVLLVDDDEALLRLLTVVLRKAGYRVLSSASPRQAFECWQCERDRVRLLITDLDLGAEIDGAELAQSLASDKAALKIIYMSGGDFGRLGPRRRMAHCIAKPFSMQAFAPFVEQILAEPESDQVAGLEQGELEQPPPPPSRSKLSVGKRPTATIEH